MAKRYHWTFEFVDTVNEAIRFCSKINTHATPYVQKRYPAHYHAWESLDGKEHKYICWYVY